MKKFYSLLILILLTTVTAWSQTRSWNGGNGDWNDKSKWTPFGVPTENDILEFNGISGTVSNVPAVAIKGLIVSGSDIILNGASGNSKMLTIGFGTSDASIAIYTDANLTIGNNLDIALAKNAFAAIDGTLIVATNRQYYTNAGGETKTIVNGILRNNGGIIQSAESMLEFTDGSIYQHASDQGTIPAATWSKNSNCNIEGIVSKAPGGLNQIFGNYKWDCVYQTGGASLGNAVPSDIRGNLVINKTGAANDPAAFIQFPEKINIEGSLVINGGTSMVKGTISTIDLAGDFAMTGGDLKASATSAGNGIIDINFKGNTRQAFSKSGGVIEKSNGAITRGEIKFTILENAIIDFGESVLNGAASFTVAAGAKLMTAHPEGLCATGSAGSVQVTGTRTYSSDADYAYTGSAHQVTGLGLPAVVRRLIIDNSAGVQTEAGVTLSKATSVNTELVLTNGFVQTTAVNMLTIMDDGNATASDNSFVAGPMRKEGKSSFTFPTGWSGTDGGLIPIALSSLSTSSVIQAEYKRAPATNKGNTINAPLHHISYCEYWELFPITGKPTAIVTMYRNAHSNCNPISTVQDFFTFRVARSNGSAWTEIGNADGTMSSVSGYVVSDSAGITMSSTDKYFALGNISSSKDPLPVLYDSVWAYGKNGGVNIEWSNLTERDIAVYFVERSVNGKDYSIIGQQLPKSNRDDKASYVSFDPSPIPGTNYYRIKTIVKSTKIIFSRIMSVETDMPQQSFNLYPNPLRSGQATLSLSGMKEGKYFLRVINSTGQEIYSKNIINQGGFISQSLELPSQIKTGIYNIVVTGDQYKISKSFIVQ
ncbi:MAG: T9SS type A sorting domain-containing protein [Chitinophagaceae bacterium]